MFLRKAASSKGAESDEEANGVDNSDGDLDSLPEGWNKNIYFNWNDNLNITLAWDYNYFYLTSIKTLSVVCEQQ